MGLILPKIPYNISESNLINRICQELQLYENQKKLYFIRNNSGATDTGIKYICNKCGQEVYLKIVKNKKRNVLGINRPSLICCNTHMQQANKNRFFRFGKKGSADIMIFYDSKVLFIEAKVKSNCLSDTQKEFKSIIEELGFEYMVIREHTNLTQILKDRAII
jgi:hypothetical protein